MATIQPLNFTISVIFSKKNFSESSAIFGRFWEFCSPTAAINNVFLRNKIEIVWPTLGQDTWRVQWTFVLLLVWKSNVALFRGNKEKTSYNNNNKMFTWVNFTAVWTT